MQTLIERIDSTIHPLYVPNKILVPQIKPRVNHKCRFTTATKMDINAKQ